MRFAALTLGVVLMTATAAQAAPITYAFQGSVSLLPPDSDLWFPGLDIGSALTGTFTIDVAPDAPVINTHFAFDVGPYSFSSVAVYHFESSNMKSLMTSTLTPEARFFVDDMGLDFTLNGTEPVSAELWLRAAGQRTIDGVLTWGNPAFRATADFSVPEAPSGALLGLGLTALLVGRGRRDHHY